MCRLARGTLLASFLTVALALLGVVPAGAAVPLSGVVSNSAVSWTPNVSAGTSTTSVCDQWFGSGGCGDATIYSTAVVNGEVIVAGAFTQVCEPGPASSGHCAAGTTVTRDDIFAYQLGTGTIDPNFVPELSNGPVYSVVAGPDDTVYVGGAFSTVNGVSHGGVVQLNVTPSTASTDGTVVTAFQGNVSNFVESMALSGTALYVGGQFITVDSTREDGVARLNATTGAVDTSFAMSISNTPASGQALKVEALSVSASGQQLAIAGPFLDVAGQSRPRVALINTGGGLGQTATLANWAAPILANNCSSEHDDVRAIDLSPDGSFLVIADTGYKSSPASSASVCDAAARFPTAATGTDIAPTWINYTGGDSFYSVQVTGAVVYLGGHNRWTNNECGNNAVCAPNAVLDMGLTAVDANTGLAIPWFHPLTERGNGTVSLTAIPAGDYAGSDGGLLVGNDVNTNAGAYHAFNMFLPLTSAAPASPTFGSIPSGIFSQGNLGGHDEGQGGDGIAAMCVDDAGDSTTAGSPVEFETCTNAAEQNWTVQSGGNIEVNGLCLDTAGQATASGTKVEVNTCGSSATQVWTQGTGNTLINKASGLCLTDPSASTTAGTVLDITACSAGTDQVWPLPSAPPPASLTPTGTIYSADEHSIAQPACITDNGNSKTSGTAAIMSSCYGSPAMEATIESNGNIEIDGLCLDTAGEATASGTQVVLNTCGTSATQVWTQGSGYELNNSGAAGLCLNISSPENGSTMDIASCTDQNTQQWRLPTV
jgi:Ricin-type beta-trefoil lectin domain/Domain of unknown function (DUF5122) beta-propeller